MRELIIDSFAGGGGASTGIEMALGRSPDIAINHDPDAMAMHEVNHPDTLHLSKNIWQVDPLDAVGNRPVGLAWFSPDCFPAGTLVLTREGYRAIEEIEVGDEVLTHRQRWRKVTETSRTSRPLLTLRGHGHPGLQVSPEHPFYARLRKDVWQTEPRGYRRSLLPADWIPASMLDRGWYWAAPTQFPKLDVPPVGGRGFSFDLRLMWLVGRYLGDGWTRLTETRAELVITCGKHEIDRLRDHLSVWPREGARATSPGELTWHERATETAYQFTANHRGLVDWLRENFGHGAESKRLPSWIFGLDPMLRNALLEGYCSADGWRGERFTETRTVSKALAFSMKALLNSLDHTVTVHLLPNQSVIEGREINARPIYLLRWRHEPDPAHAQTFREDGLEWAPIREQSEIGEEATVFNIGVEEDESYVVEGIIVHNCKHFSKAKGGRPVKRSIRDLAWVVVLWAKRARPRVIILENVEEFKDWGPVTAEGRPCQERKGETFRKWTNDLKRLGYKIQWRELRGCDYGAPTIRKRLFMIARRDGLPIVWPKPTHGRPDDPDVIAGRKKLWLTAASDVIDWSIPCPSIFDTSEEIMAKFGVRAIRPLAEATMKRIARGVVRYVLEAERPFIISVAHGDSGGRREYSVDEPVGTQTTSGKSHAVVVPSITKFRTNSTGQPVDEPLHTVTANSYVKRPGGASPLGLVAATMVQTGYGERPGQAPRSLDVEGPLGTQVAGGAKHAVVAAFLAQHNTDMVGHDARKPLSTIVGKGCTQGLIAAHLQSLRGSDRRDRPVDAPAPTATAGGNHDAVIAAHISRQFGKGTGHRADEPMATDTAAVNKSALIAPFLTKYYGTGGQWARADDPMHTLSTKDRMGLVTVEIDGQTYAIADIGMRMLNPRERFRAQGFPDSYIIDRRPDGTPLTQTVQGRCCGNSVCPPLAAALVAANCGDLAINDQEAAA